jgi:hypothetical protein
MGQMLSFFKVEGDIIFDGMDVIISYDGTNVINSDRADVIIFHGADVKIFQGEDSSHL